MLKVRSVLFVSHENESLKPKFSEAAQLALDGKCVEVHSLHGAIVAMEEKHKKKEKKEKPDDGDDGFDLLVCDENLPLHTSEASVPHLGIALFMYAMKFGIRATFLVRSPVLAVQPEKINIKFNQEVAAYCFTQEHLQDESLRASVESHLFGKIVKRDLALVE